MEELKVFRDPLYGYVKVSHELIWKLIQTKEFQRLRRIRQLGGVFVVYHTAEHSRFSHSLGVYEVARRILYEVSDVNNTLTEKEKLITLCAALLHDVGHGPYSHTFEMIFNTNHEEWTKKILLNEHTEVHQVLESYEEGFAKKVVRIINKECYLDDCLGANCHHRIMSSIISSQLDADRLDYLQRDAYNTGTSYGEIDLDRLIRSFLIVDNQIAFKFTSMHAIESYLLSRYHMYWQVYYHPVAISFEIILMLMFRRVKALIEAGYKFNVDISLIKKIINNQLTTEDYLQMDEPWINYLIQHFCREQDKILADLSNRFMNRHLFKYITCANQQELDTKYQTLENIFSKYNINSDYYLYRDTISKEAYQYYTDDYLHTDPILLLVKDKLVEIAELSHVVKGIKSVGPKTDYKLYYPIEVLDEFSSEDKELIMSILSS